MEKEVQQKVERFIELSRQFTKSSVELFGYSNEEVCSGHGQMSLQDVCRAIGYSYMSEYKEPTRAEKIRKEAEEKAKLAEEYDEYIQLQTDLSKYFQALNNLNN